MIQLEDPLNLNPNTIPNGDNHIFENEKISEHVHSPEKDILSDNEVFTSDSESVDSINPKPIEAKESSIPMTDESLQSNQKESVSPDDSSEVATVTVTDIEDSIDIEAYLKHINDMFNGKRQYMMEMIEILLSQIPEALTKMKSAILLENWEEVFFQSHRIKSTLKIVGLQDLVKICLGIESRTRIIVADELHLVPGLFEQFEALCQQEMPRLEAAVHHLQEQLKEETPSPIVDATSDDLDLMLLP